ncbi:MAG: glycerol-3-phosphate 1-O-acyltransferase PlsY [Actinobacteria bacterium]|nr:glycerol-3-phosphate 1-O-acyltransferase PlsY [Actinomycetota bacterium]MBV8394849.1 glycerol-3-phosphate 1-O-acyltransferase PlsY [Actinomycetota bacterium]MBV8598988.1 glycerol-3-phosphate 1-O-acyltransferase PlsY [Actinomycetota bacterium]
MTFAAVVVAGYLLGSCPWGYWLVRLVHHQDIRTVGSGNVGGTNVWRVYGKRLGLTVIVLDVLKAFVPALLGVLLVSHLCGILAGAAAMLGHWRPLFLGFARGGKMVASAAGVFLAVAVWVALGAACVWWLFFLTTRYVSVASIAAALSLPVFAALFGYPREVIVFSGLAAVGVLLLHRGNLRRLRAGTENRATLRRTARSSA